MTKLLHATPFIQLYENENWQFASRNPPDALYTGKVNAAKVIAFYESEEDIRVVLVRQFRQPVGDYVIELPAGLVEPGEDPKDTIIREFQEETGLTLTLSNNPPYPSYPSPGLTDEKHLLYVGMAKGSKLDMAGVDEESIEVFTWTEEEILKAIRGGAKFSGDLAMLMMVFEGIN